MNRLNESKIAVKRHRSHYILDRRLGMLYWLSIYKTSFVNPFRNPVATTEQCQSGKKREERKFEKKKMETKRNERIENKTIK